MSGGRNQRALLMEIMIAVLFFALCASVLLQTFAAARECSRSAGVQGAALLEAQSLANRLSASDDMAAALRAQAVRNTTTPTTPSLTTTKTSNYPSGHAKSVPAGCQKPS